MTDDAKKVARRIREAIEKATPDEVEAWDGALPLVRGPTDRFHDRLRDWENEDMPVTRADLQNAAGTSVRAWREGGERFRASRTSEEVPA